MCMDKMSLGLCSHGLPSLLLHVDRRYFPDSIVLLHMLFNLQDCLKERKCCVH